MKSFFLLFFLSFFSCAFSLHLLVSEGEVPYELKRKAYREVLLKEDYPMCLAFHTLPSTMEITQKLKKIHPRLKAEWVPTSLFQLFVVHSYFSDSGFREFVHHLGYSMGLYDPNDPSEVEKFEIFREKHGISWDLNIDEKVVETLSHPSQSLLDLVQLYQELNARPAFSDLFLRMNDAFLQRKSPSLMEDLLKEIPKDLKAWQTHHFPFLFKDPKCENMKLLIDFFSTHQEILRKTVAEEKKAYQEGNFLIYRGAEVILLQGEDQKISPLLHLPFKAKNQGEFFCKEKEMSSFSLSYANSLFGGIFFSLDACAARYSQPTAEQYVFHALKLGKKELLEDLLFCLPPLHPFVEMFIDGEWFHPHSKIAPRKEDPRCYGWYAKGNQVFTDRLGFIFQKGYSPEDLGEKILKLTEEKAVILYQLNFN